MSYMVAILDSHGCFYGEPEFFDSKEKAIKFGNALEIEKTFHVSLFSLRVESVLQDEISKKA